jgi:soluble lytic murein transglycosylase-like protein
MSTNKLYYLLGVLTTTLSVVAYMEIVEPDTPIQTKTETVVRMVNVPFTPSAYELQADGIKSSLNKSKLKHILIYTEALCWEYGVDYEMVKAVIQTESDWNHKAVSTSGAIGLMQILPSTAMSEFQTPKQDLFDPYVNVTVGIKYLSQLNEHFDDLESTLTAYSHGPTVTKKYSNNYISNNFYVKRVQKNLK